VLGPIARGQQAASQAEAVIGAEEDGHGD
jgi:hypothetical protein